MPSALVDGARAHGAEPEGPRTSATARPGRRSANGPPRPQSPEPPAALTPSSSRIQVAPSTSSKVQSM